MATIDLGKIKLVWRGTYNNSTAYTVDDIVEFTDSGITSTYICVANSTGNNPSSGGTAHASWNYMAKGVVDPIPSQSGNSGKFLKTDGSALSFDQAGKILNIYHAVKSGKQTFSSSSWVDISGLSLTITPQLSNSKFLVRVLGYGAPRDQVYFMGVKLVKVVGGSTSDFSSMTSNDSNRFGAHATIGTTNSPYSGTQAQGVVLEQYHQVSSTDSITFKVQAKQGYDANQPCFWNSSDYTYNSNGNEIGLCTSCITAIEYN